VTAAVVTLLMAAGCSDSDGTPSGERGARDDGRTQGPAGATTDPTLEGCDPLDATACLLPFPNDGFTEAAETPTGRRVRLPADGMPTNATDVPIDSADMDRADGFSPGSTLLVGVPGLDVATTEVAPSTDIGASLDEGAPIVLLDAESREPVPYWAELDSRAPEDARLLTVHPATSLAEGHRYLVGLRGLLDESGEPVPSSAEWQQVVDGTLEPASRVTHLQGVEAQLDEWAGTDEDWWMAWDFTVASAKSLSGRLLHIRDAAYEELGTDAPAFTVDAATDAGGVRTVTGTFEVPLFLTSAGPGGRFRLDGEGVPERGEGTIDARFVCVVPSDPDEAAQPIVYGHGLLGSAQEVQSLAVAVPLGNLAACATDWIGMSSEDLPNVAQILADLSEFPELADRLQQGHVAMSFLGRLLNHAEGFASDPAFQDPTGEPVIDSGATQFVGNSQGGILGGAASAVSTEWDRAVLGVPGINYSVLLPRSVDFDPFASVFEAAYTDPIERTLALSLIQLLWDRGENQGYAQHLTAEPYDGIEAKDVLLIEAFGDHQVANVATEVLARTIGARVHRPVLGEGRSNDVEAVWDVPALEGDRDGSALVVWDYGTPAPPPGNVAPRPPEYGDDPHGAGVQEPRVLAQAFGFLGDGVTDDVCAGGPCVSEVLG